jgi:subtilisin
VGDSVNKEPTERYILLPARSLTGASSLVGSKTRHFLSCCAASFSSQRRLDKTSPAEAIDTLPLGSVEVIDSIAPEGAKLVDLTWQGLKEIKTLQPGLQVVPVQYYTLALQPRVQLKRTHFTVEPTKLRVLDAHTGLPIPHAQVRAVLDSATSEGVQATSNAQGEVSLPIPPATPIARLHVYPRSGYWTLVQHDLILPPELHLVPIEPGFRDGLRHFYPEAKLTDGAGVKVGVLDTGIADHPDLVVAGGCNVVPFEDPHDWQDNGEGHGTHIAGIIAARGTRLRGLAPGVELRSYRICATGSGMGSSWAVAKAILRASQDGCDILNLSLGGGPHDPTVHTAIRDARMLGCVVFCASGNDNRAPVMFPASDPLTVAVSAVGREGTYPEGAEQWSNIVHTPPGKDRQNYIAAFSNVGPELSLTAPGDGIISTFPGGYAVMTGTSMACPAAAARAAVLLANDPELLASPRDVDRADELVTRIMQSATSLGFGANFEGNGLLP